MSDLDKIFETTIPPTAGEQAAPPAPAPPAKKGRPRNPPKAGKPEAAKATNGAKRGPRRQPVHALTRSAVAPDPVAEKKQRARKPRNPPKAGKAPKGVKLDLTTMMSALVGLKSDDAALVHRITQALQTVNKKSRARVLEAVGRIFT